MGTTADHIALANKNHDALEYLLMRHTDFPEWVVTVAFYTSVQIAEAIILTQKGGNSHSHNSRNRMLKLFDPPSLFRNYRALWNASCVARYLSEQENPKGYSSFSDFSPPYETIINLSQAGWRDLNNLPSGC